MHRSLLIIILAVSLIDTHLITTTSLSNVKGSVVIPRRVVAQRRDSAKSSLLSISQQITSPDLTSLLCTSISRQLNQVKDIGRNKHTRYHTITDRFSVSIDYTLSVHQYLLRTGPPRQFQSLQNRIPARSVYKVYDVSVGCVLCDGWNTKSRVFQQRGREWMPAGEILPHDGMIGVASFHRDHDLVESSARHGTSVKLPGEGV
jgi:hypothetical protein